MLAHYPVSSDTSREVAVELAWCTISSGKYKGQHAIEVRLDGYRVGELTYAMSQRYGTMLNALTSNGHRPGCEAIVHIGRRGIEIDLRLPRDPAAIQIPPAIEIPATQAARPAHRKREGLFASHKAAWITGGAVGILLIALINAPEDSPSSTSGPVLPVTTTTSSTTTSTTTTTTSSTTSEIPAPPPVVEPPKANTPPATTPKRNPVTTTPKTTPPPKPPPPPPAPPQSKCDPNYTGCVPVASDVDCAGGSGNGPAYVSGPIRVIGKDIYGLDNDKDGIACE